ncbi:hypothetical protein KQI42_15815 [Tissierella sp. MSJ-40]|uniref:Uncharacterized protein n=1 Tax=Tissierella simiarum TaxID=2841534 RepID=A0ABS6E9M9_9FIRM|nr:hypothetical protein [Tissierella simiarum]MBU5439482.1 hypothetical protein [Tissierella simiarum]
MEDKIEESIKFLEENNYIIIKRTKKMFEDMEECEEMQVNGIYKECLNCSCNICVCNQWT